VVYCYDLAVLSTFDTRPISNGKVRLVEAPTLHEDHNFPAVTLKLLGVSEHSHSMRKLSPIPSLVS